MSEPAPAAAMTDRDEGGRYLVDGGRLAHRKVTRDGTFVESLCNFDAQVIEELALDDGAEAARAFVLTGRLCTGEPLPAVRVPAGKFAGLEWLAEAWGHRPIVRAGAGVRDQLREAMLSLSLGARTRTLYTHTGWRQHGGRWVFLHGGGALGATGVDGEGVEVELGRELGRYALPAEPEDVREAMQGSLALLRVAPLRVTVPLWAAMYRAPLAAAVPTDQALWLEGVSGSLKSTLAALFLAHFGPFDRLTLPANWSSTANGLERAAFLAKDVPLVIDDWAPGGLDARELELKAARLLRAQGNAAGRGRLRADLTERPNFYPRGLLLATGEQHPVGASVLARLVLVECARDLVALDRLSAAQARANRLPHAMASYLRWLAPTMAHLTPVLRAGITAVRGRAGVDGAHLRIPEDVANLWVGLDRGLAFAQEIGACSAAEADELRAAGWAALAASGAAQHALVEGERPSHRFLGVVLALISQKKAALCSAYAKEDVRDLIGWIDDENLYLDPVAAFAAVARFCRDSGDPFPVRETRLRRDLDREGLLDGHEGRTTASLRLGGRARRVLRLRREAVELITGPFPTPEEPEAGA